MLNLYGLLISISIFICISLLVYLSKKDDVIWELSFWAITSGIIGARIYHVLDYIQYYSQNPAKILFVWNGGLGIWGAIIGGFIGVLTYLILKKDDVFYWLDLIGVVAPLGQTVGRWGNFFNKEIYGKPTNLPWGMDVEGIKVHPLFLYESLLNFLLFLVLLATYKKEFFRKGTYFGIYIGGYSVIRIFMETLRIESWKIQDHNVTQLLSILMLILSVVVIFWRNKDDIYNIRSRRFKS